MLPTFVIGLREGLEAALIVGIIAAFLKQQGRRDLLRKVWLGVVLAALLCLGVGIGLHVLSTDLPQKQQEGLETVVGAIAVVMVTYMVVWMRRHSRDLKAQLEGAAGSALASGSGLALVAMAFLSVFREGFETAVFLLAAFNNSSNPQEAGAGALLGLAVAIVLGYGIYRGGVRLNLSKFFRFTGLVLVLVAAGLVVSAFHTAHEAGWLNSGQAQTFDLTWLVQPGSVRSSLLTGMLGLQPRPVVIELIGWLVYLIPVGLFVMWPPGRQAPHRAVVRIGAPVAVAALAAALALTFAGPARPSVPTRVSFADGQLTLATTGAGGVIGVPVADRGAIDLDLTVTRAGVATAWRLSGGAAEGQAGRGTTVYTKADQPVALPSSSDSRATTLTLAQVQAANGGRLPLGVRATTEAAAIPVRHSGVDALTVWVDDQTGRVLNVKLRQQVVVTATLSVGATQLSGGGSTTTIAASEAEVTAAAARAAHDERVLDERDLLDGFRLAAWLIFVGAVLASATSAFAVRRRPKAANPPSVVTPATSERVRT